MVVKLVQDTRYVADWFPTYATKNETLEMGKSLEKQWTLASLKGHGISPNWLKLIAYFHEGIPSGSQIPIYASIYSWFS